MPGACRIALESARLGWPRRPFHDPGAHDPGRARDERRSAERRAGAPPEAPAARSAARDREGAAEPQLVRGQGAQDLERPAAIKRLLDTGLIEPAPAPQHYRVTEIGRAHV